jgi:hypothetical protein
MKTKEVIKQLLLDKPHLRDNDNRLICTYWFMELKKKNIDPNKINALEFMQYYANSKLTNTETIRRQRAKLQEEHPELRGEAYNTRKGILQDKWRSELGYENNK